MRERFLEGRILARNALSANHPKRHHLLCASRKPNSIIMSPVNCRAVGAFGRLVVIFHRDIFAGVVGH